MPMIEATIESIRTGRDSNERVVVLMEKSWRRYLPIWVSTVEAGALALTLKKGTNARPFSHDLLCSMVGAMGGAIDFVSICELTGDTFHATIVIRAHGRQIELDSRPSDALAVATRAGVPIYVEETIMDRAGVLTDKENTEPVTEDKQEGLKQEGGPEEDLKKLSAFRDFINGLDSDDLEKHKS